jgi:hypothetical protein
MGRVSEQWRKATATLVREEREVDERVGKK